MIGYFEIIQFLCKLCESHAAVEMNILHIDNRMLAFCYPVRLSTMIRIKVFMQKDCPSISILQSLGTYGLESQGEKYRNLGGSGKVKESHGNSGNFLLES